MSPLPPSLIFSLSPALKAVVYNLLPTSKNTDGRLGLSLNGDLEEIKTNVDRISAHLQNNVLKGLIAPGVHEVKVDTVRLLQDGNVEVIFQVTDKNQEEPVPASILDEHIKSFYQPAPAGAATTSTSTGMMGFGKPGLGSTLPGAAPTANPAHASARQALEQLGCHNVYDMQQKVFLNKVRREFFFFSSRVGAE